MNQIKLKKITLKDHSFLYELLEKRDKIVNISHKKMPTFSQHQKFIESKPYQYWYIIYEERNKIGSIYLSKINEIGISILKEKQNQGFEENALELIMKKHKRKRFLANVSSKNKKLESFFKKQGFKKIQHTYEFSNEK